MSVVMNVRMKSETNPRRIPGGARAVEDEKAGKLFILNENDNILAELTLPEVEEFWPEG